MYKILQILQNIVISPALHLGVLFTHIICAEMIKIIHALFHITKSKLGFYIPFNSQSLALPDNKNYIVSVYHILIVF